MLDRFLDWDKQLFIYLNGLGQAKYDFFWATLTQITTWIPLFLAFIYLFFHYHPPKQALKKVLWVILLAIFIIIATYFSKMGFSRPRPNTETALLPLIRILKTPTDFSFFSGHAASSFSITVLIYLFLRGKIKWAALFFAWPLLFSYSRIYVGVHYPLDILVGALVGVISGALFYRVFMIMEKV